MEKSDVYITGKLFGVEAQMKSEQDWYYINNKTKPVFDFIQNFTSDSIANKLSEESESQSEPITKDAGVPLSRLVYNETSGIARDILKAGPAGSEVVAAADIDGTEVSRYCAPLYEPFAPIPSDSPPEKRSSSPVSASTK